MPVRLSDGNFLFLFNGVCTPGQSGCTPLNRLNTTVQYAPSFAILNGSNLTQVLQRAEEPLLTPILPWEAGTGSRWGGETAAGRARGDA